MKCSSRRAHSIAALNPARAFPFPPLPRPLRSTSRRLAGVTSTTKPMASMPAPRAKCSSRSNGSRPRMTASRGCKSRPSSTGRSLVSLKVFGLTTAAARLPIALATVASVALTFLIGDRLGGPWRGFLAGLIHLCCCGTFLLGRIVMPEPLFSALIAGAIYCAIRGYEQRRGRRGWFIGFWICVGARLHDEEPARAALSGGDHRFAFLFLSGSAPAVSRIACAGMGFSIFLLIAAPWHIWLEWQHPGFLSQFTAREWFVHLGGRDGSGSQLRQRAAPHFSRAALRLVVSVVGRNSARRFARLAARFSSARN